MGSNKGSISVKILFIALSDSIHTTRWINQVIGTHDVHLFPSIDTGGSHANLHGISIYHTIYSDLDNLGSHLKLYGLHQPDTTTQENIVMHNFRSLLNVCYIHIKKGLQFIYPQYRARSLANVIKAIKPDIIHSLEMQSGAYLVNETKKIYRGHFPIWIVSNWGSDIYLFGKQKEHKPKIRAVLKNCNYYMCECERDVKLARSFGYRGEVLGVFPNAGGYDTKKYAKYGKVPPSQRKAIMIKGYQGWAGRSLIVLDAIDLVGQELSKRKYRLIVYSTAGNKVVENRAREIAKRHRLPIEMVPLITDHEQIIRFHGEARVSIGLSISDGISTSLLESMMMGSFPIQSYTSCADEWILNGVTGMLIPPENKMQVVKALRKAIQDDQLVDKAAILNMKTITERASYHQLRQKTLDIYKKLLD